MMYRCSCCTIIIQGRGLFCDETKRLKVRWLAQGAITVPPSGQQVFQVRFLKRQEEHRRLLLPQNRPLRCRRVSESSSLTCSSPSTSIQVRMPPCRLSLLQTTSSWTTRNRVLLIVPLPRSGSRSDSKGRSFIQRTSRWRWSLRKAKSPLVPAVILRWRETLIGW